MDASWSRIEKCVTSLKSEFLSAECNYAKGIALFGAGQFGRSAYNYLKKNNFNITGFIDNASDKRIAGVEGIPVLPPDDGLIDRAGIIFITARHAVLQIKEQLVDLGLPNMSFDAWFAMKRIKEYAYIRNNVFSDDVSKKTLDGILLAMMTGNEKYCAEIVEKDQYFCLPQFINTGNEYFIDAGAYVGDTAEKFIQANNGGFRHIFAFEPGGRQVKAFETRRQRLVEEWALTPDSISVIAGGLGEKDRTATLAESNSLLSTTLNMDAGGNNISDNVKVYSIDSYFKEKPVTFIKADIEGMEIPMLRGAELTIKREKPKMAISTYHEPDDLIEIIKIIKSYVPEYTMALRHHSPLLMDTTLYCWLEN